MAQTDLWTGFFKRHFDDNAIAKRLFQSVGVDYRHAVVSPLVENVSSWSTQKRIERYSHEALPLAQRAVREALQQAAVGAADIGLFVVVSCTGYVTPGLDTLVARDLGMATNVQRLVIGHMGCYAALPALATANDYVTAQDKPAVMLCVELASVHVQPPTNDVEQMVAHALFSDAASATVLTPGSAPTKLEVVETAAVTDTSRADLMTWTVTDQGFRMTLSAKVPDVLAEHVKPMIGGMLARHDLNVEDVVGWAAHPGGPLILDVIGEQLELKPDDLTESRAILREHGNCSSATVLLVLDEVQRNRITQADQYVVAMAFGPGLTLYATLLRSC